MSQKKNKRLRNQVVEIKSEVGKVTFGVRNILKENWKFLILLCIGVFLIYFNALNADFVSDDYASITQNPDILNLGAMFKASGIPGITNSLIATVFGIKSPVSYHLVSVVLFMLVCIFAFIFLDLLFEKKLAILTLTLFAYHPIHVEAITWISGRPYLYSTLFVLVALISTLMYLNTKKKYFIWVVLASLIMMFFTDKIRGFTYFLILGLMAVTFKQDYTFMGNLKKYFKYLIIPIIIIAIFAYPMAKTRIETVNSGYNASDSIFYNPFFQYPTAITKYLQLLFIPVDLTLYHTLYILPLRLNWAVIILYLGSLVYFWFKNKLVFFALAFIFVASSPSMLPVKVSWLVAERYVFFGSIGFCLLLGIIINNISKKSKWVGMSILGVVAGIYFFRTYFRNVDWQTNHKLWVSTCQVSPNSHNAWNNIGDDYDKLGQYDNAIKGFTQSTVVKPNYADAYHNRANIFFKTGRLDLARDSYNTALGYSPGLYQTYMSLIQIDLTEKRGDLAVQDSQKLLSMQPNNPQAWYVAGVVFANVGDSEKAKMAFKNALTIMPNFSQAQQALTQLLGGS